MARMIHGMVQYPVADAGMRWTCRVALLSISLLGTTQFHAWGQARIVLNNDAWIRIDNGAWLVVEDPDPAAIATMGSGGNIRSEAEFDRIRWQIRGSTGTYVVPFTSANGNRMPLSYTVTTPGSSEPQASVCFSTYNHASVGVPLADAWNNFLYRPTDVTHMNSYNAPSVPNSQNAVDRFWIIDPGVAGFAYGTRPSIVLGFTYDPGAVTGEVTPGNAIGPGDPVGAQRFNNAAGIWGDMLPVGVFAGGTPSTVSGAAVASVDFFRSWTLANFLDPLPVELVDFTRSCVDDAVILRWSTGSERNSSHFEVQRSTDGIKFETVGTVTAAGTSQSLIHYEHVDARTPGLVYHRLRQVDQDGSYTIGPVVVGSCAEENGLALVNAWDSGSELNVSISSPNEQDATLYVYDAAGRHILQRDVFLNKGGTLVGLPIQGTAQGIYLIRLVSATGSLARRVNRME